MAPFHLSSDGPPDIFKDGAPRDVVLDHEWYYNVLIVSFLEIGAKRISRRHYVDTDASLVPLPPSPHLERKQLSGWFTKLLGDRKLQLTRALQTILVRFLPITTPTTRTPERGLEFHRPILQPVMSCRKSQISFAFWIYTRKLAPVDWVSCLSRVVRISRSLKHALFLS
jgi:hypothetical protein